MLFRKNENFQFNKIVGVSAVTGYRMEFLKGVIRKLIDLDAESKRENVTFTEFLQRKKQEFDVFDDENNDD